jgi:ATP-dependent DNA ligase
MKIGFTGGKDARQPQWQDHQPQLYRSREKLSNAGAARQAREAEILEISFPHQVKDEAVTTWVKPPLVAEVKFTEWTSSGEMRHPVYLGLRTDKRAEDVVREREKSRG